MKHNTSCEKLIRVQCAVVDELNSDIDILLKPETAQRQMRDAFWEYHQDHEMSFHSKAQLAREWKGNCHEDDDLSEMTAGRERMLRHLGEATIDAYRARDTVLGHGAARGHIAETQSMRHIRNCVNALDVMADDELFYECDITAPEGEIIQRQQLHDRIFSSVSAFAALVKKDHGITVEVSEVHVTQIKAA